MAIGWLAQQRAVISLGALEATALWRTRGSFGPLQGPQEVLQKLKGAPTKPVPGRPFRALTMSTLEKTVDR
ncbi:MAG: hypothetical protein NZ959_09425 [Armatimonadetes bacterium]|nr:hypothetical protein [Armatimonadota bacterium]MDW8122193.1 hypothetical protein [Armatimonadota bacterium]